MAHLVNVPWPPDPIATERLVLRATQAPDRPACIELFSDEKVHRYLGGASDRVQVEAAMPPIPGNRPGVFAVEADREFIGLITVDRRDADRPGHITESAEELEVGYLFLPDWWGNHHATESVGAVLVWAQAHFPAEPIVLCTQIANEASLRLATRLGFREVERFVEYGSEQWFGVLEPFERTSLTRA